jgi:drug/metabolite transporter (DMT)-like permease
VPPSLLRHPLAQIHFCVLLWGFTAILGKLITLDAVALVFWRVLAVSATLLLLPQVWRGIAGVTRRDLFIAVAGGLLVTAHWLAFFGSVKLANASVAATCIALAPVFLAVIEPFANRRPFNLHEVVVSVAAVPGVLLVVGGIPSGMLSGFVAGAAAALLVAIFGIVNKRLTARVPALSLTCLQLGTGALALGLLVPFWPLLGGEFSVPAGADIGWLALLAYVCTLLPFSLMLVAMRQLTVFKAQLAVNLEPVYSIILAAIIFNESRELGWSFYLGVALIIGAVIYPAPQPKSPSR